MYPLVLIIALLLLNPTQSTLRPDPDTICASCDVWNQPIDSFRLFGNTYYVGPAGLSALLVTSDSGHILLDAGLTQSAAVIDRNIRTLGFRTEDVRYILASHEHYDHVGGIAALQRLSGATVFMSAPGVRALATGGPLQEDPQFGMGVKENAFPSVTQTRAVADREVVTLGPLAVTAHLTPGHTPGGTSWTWRSCEAERCLDIVYADSLTAISADGFRFTGGGGRPDITAIFRATIDRIEQLPCDIIVSTHPGSTGLSQKLLLRDSGQTDAFVDPDSCRTYAATARTNLERRIAREHNADPRLLRFLTQQPEFRLITPEDVEPDGPWMVKAGHFRALVVGDVRGRGTLSTLAVVMAARGGEKHLGLVELHGVRPDVAWVIEPRAFDLLSVTLKGTQVWPMICYDCDSGSFFRWNGTAWEFQLWAPGDAAFVGVLDDPPVDLRRDPTLGAPVVARIPTCRDEQALILAVGSGEGRDRWYRVRVQVGGKPVEGFVRGRDLGNGQECIG